MWTDIINITIKVNQGELLDNEEVVDSIRVNLQGILTMLDETGGDIQKLKSEDDLSCMQYTHTKVSQ